ncbi:hypothetical protein ACQHGV_08435 [Sphingomonas pseudosanguinis]|uniref:hypothetical protein n=1 Tax=Sphingomonas pseudosanguinis TaxID=413712 RepID=UPI003F87DA8B
MDVKVTVTGPAGQRVEHVVGVRQAGDLAELISQALDMYRGLYPDAPPFEKTVKIEHG